MDVIGLSGLITPSLEEMVHVASEMQRHGLDCPVADRRGDNLGDPYRGEDSPAIQSPGHPCQGCVALRGRAFQSFISRNINENYTKEIKEKYLGPEDKT